MSNQANPSPSASPRSTYDAAKETLESIVIALVLAFAFRAYVVEAFVIPTGSMAPTLLGQHYSITCEQCGYSFAVDTPYRDTGAGVRDLEAPSQARCPQCHFPNVLRQGLHASAGDRILVLKYLYDFIPPRRWDVVVFKNPEDPSINFIKRLVGLPGEQLIILDGNVYVRSAGDAAWSIARKTGRPEVQEAVWQPVYNSQYVPLDGGDGGLGRIRYRWDTPWVAQQAGFHVDGRRVYTFDGQGRGRITFHPDRQLHDRSIVYPYNQLKNPNLPTHPIEDVRVAATFLPSDAGLSLSLSTTARLDRPDAPLSQLIGRIDAQGRAHLEALDDGATELRSLAQVQIAPLRANRATEVELHYVDQEASLWVDGEPILRWGYELELSQLAARPAAPAFPAIAIEVSGSPVQLHRVRVDRDLYYWSLNADGSQQARGSIVRSRSGPVGEPVQIPVDHYFCMGDNSPLSHDGRYWNRLDPWIERLMLDRGEFSMGTVPQELMMGRAFFVYFPAPLRLDPQGGGLQGAGIIPNFGQMRMIR